MAAETEDISRAVLNLAAQHGWATTMAGRQTFLTGAVQGRALTIQHESRLEIWMVVVATPAPVPTFGLLARGGGHRGWGDRLQYGKTLSLPHPALERQYVLRTRDRVAVARTFSRPALVELLLARAPTLWEWHTDRYGHRVYFHSDRSESLDASLSDALHHALAVARCHDG